MHWALFITLFIGLIAYASASDVLVFTDSDFETKVKQYDILLAEFYAPWCGHCKCFSFGIWHWISNVGLTQIGKRLAPEYEKAAAALAKNDPPVALAKVNANLIDWNENITVVSIRLIVLSKPRSVVNMVLVVIQVSFLFKESMPFNWWLCSIENLQKWWGCWRLQRSTRSR